MSALTSLNSAQGREPGALHPRSAGGETASEDFLTETLSDPSAVDVYRIACKGKLGPVCTDVNDPGPSYDNKFYAQMTCIKPGKTYGTTAKAIAPEGGFSNPACVPNCKEALVSYSCQDSHFCDDNYDSFAFCEGRDTIVKKSGLIQDQ